MRNKGILRLTAALLAVVLCIPAFSMTAFAGGGPEVGTEETGETSTTSTDSTEPGNDTTGLKDMDITDLLSALSGFGVSARITDDGIQISSGMEDTGSHQTGTVTTNGGNLNVRNGVGLDNTAFTQLPNGTSVEVIGTDGDWIKILLPERVGYVYSDYLTISDTGLQGHRTLVNSAVVLCFRYSQGNAEKYITRRLPFCGCRRLHFSRLLWLPRKP